MIRMGISGWLGMQVILILAIVLILFGAKKIPELAKGLGQGIKEFKKATKEVTDEIQNTAADTKRRTNVTPARCNPVAAGNTTVAQSQSAGNERHLTADFFSRSFSWPTTPNRNGLDEGGPVKSFLEHLEDFRWVLVKSVSASVGLAMLVCLMGANYVIGIVKWPL